MSNDPYPEVTQRVNALIEHVTKLRDRAERIRVLEEENRRLALMLLTMIRTDEGGNTGTPAAIKRIQTAKEYLASKGHLNPLRKEAQS